MPPLRDSIFNDGREAALHAHIRSLPKPSLQNNPEAILSAISDWISANKMMMTYSQAKVALSKEIISSVTPPPKTFVELGGYVGCSAIGWGSLLKEYHGDDAAAKGCKVYSCELQPNIAAIARDFIELAGLSDVVEVVVGQSSDSIRKLKDEKKVEQIDVLFLDHWEHFYVPDLMLVEDLGLLRKGSVVLADNTDFPGAPEYLEYVGKGGRGGEGGVKLETKTWKTESEESKAKAITATTVVEVPK